MSFHLDDSEACDHVGKQEQAIDLYHNSDVFSPLLRDIERICE
jgi:hypothetical protein